LIFVGKIKKIRGNKGEVVIEPSPHLDNFILKPGETVLLQSLKYKKEKKIEFIKEIKGNPVLKFSDTNHINDAYRLVGYSIYANPTDASDQSDTSLLDFLVKDLEGQSWGRINDVNHSGFNPLLEVKSPEGDMIYVPLADDIVKEIDKERKVLIINPPLGLKDLNKR
jgi:16S rRNA processing protein RimM